MPASFGTRYHEAGHAFVARRFGMLHSLGMLLASDTDASTCIVEDPDGTTEWCLLRAAVKLAGPVGRILQQGQSLEWDTFWTIGEYHRDFEEALEIFRKQLSLPPFLGWSEEIDSLMDRAREMAIEQIRRNEAALSALAEATEGADQYSLDEIDAVVQGVIESK